MATRTGRLKIGFFVVALLILCVLGMIYYWQAMGADMSNPHANFWRTVRHGVPGFMTAPSGEHSILIQNNGENWREVRNGVIMRFSQIIPVAALLAMGLFYAFVGKDRLEKPRSGQMIERYTFGERVLHWYTAAAFIIMALTGLSILLGRLVFLPIFGHWIISWFLQTAKVLHNYCGPFLLVGIFLEIVIWFRYNIPTKQDLGWFRNMGGMLGGPRPHTGKINGGEKGWFWLVLFFGVAVGITGVILDFPVWGQTRLTMQVVHIIHVSLAVLFVTASFGHIYVGTIGAEGVFEGMWTGYVDGVWAEQHNDLWYEKKIGEKGERPEITLP